MAGRVGGRVGGCTATAAAGRECLEDGEGAMVGLRVCEREGFLASRRRLARGQRHLAVVGVSQWVSVCGTVSRPGRRMCCCAVVSACALSAPLGLRSASTPCYSMGEFRTCWPASLAGYPPPRHRHPVRVRAPFATGSMQPRTATKIPPWR